LQALLATLSYCLNFCGFSPNWKEKTPMLNTYHPTESELMEEARRLLRQRLTRIAPTFPAAEPYTSVTNLHGPSPEKAQRRKRSLQSCHRPSLNERERHPAPQESGAFVPEAAARIEDDPNLTDGARRCARKLMEETYRRNRAGRSLEITVSYLGRALGKCRRTVQRYLRRLEEEGYVSIDVAAGAGSRLCVGLVIKLLAPLFPRHHKERWPETVRDSGATPESLNQRFKILVPRDSWAQRCMDGVFRALMKTNPLKDLPPVLSS
jgi:hypothetical protein